MRDVYKRLKPNCQDSSKDPIVSKFESRLLPSRLAYERDRRQTRAYFPALYNPLPSSLLSFPQTTTTTFSLPTKRRFGTAHLLNLRCHLHACHGCRYGHPTFNGPLILPDVSCLVYSSILVSLGSFLEIIPWSNFPAGSSNRHAH